MTSAQAADRHAEKRCQEHNVCEERQVENVCRKPANRRQLQEQDQEANAKKFEPVTEVGGWGVVFSQVSFSNLRARMVTQLPAQFGQLMRVGSVPFP